MNCDFSNDKNLMCTTQVKMIKRGYVLDYDFNWIKKHLIKSEIMLEYVDWLHIHNSGSCIEVFKKNYFEEYLDTCKHFEVEP